MRRAPARLPLPKWTSVRRFVAGSIALFLLLLTHQLIWSVFPNLTFKLSGRTLWMFAEAMDGNRPALAPSGADAPAIATTRSQATIRIVAPADRTLDVRHNNVPLFFHGLATGGSTARVDLRKGLNSFVATSRKGNEQYPSDRARLSIVYHPAEPAAPWILGGVVALTTARSALAQIAGFAEPESKVTLATQPKPVDVDTAGSFTAVLSTGTSDSQPSGTFALGSIGPPAPSPFLPNTIQLDLTRHGFQFADPSRTLSRQLHIQIGPDSFKLSFKLTIPVETDLFKEAFRPPGAARLLKDAVGVCIAGAHDAGLSWLSCYNGPDDPPLSPPALSMGYGPIDVQFEHALGPGPIELDFLPTTTIARLFPTLPGDELRIEIDPKLPLHVAAQGCRHDGNVIICGPGPESPSPPLGFGQILTAGSQPPPPMPGEAQGQGSAAPPNPQRTRPLDQLNQLEGIFGENVRGMIRRLLAAIPFLVLLWILRQYPLPKPSHTRTIRAVTLTFLTLHLSFLALSLFSVFLSGRSIAFIHDLGGQTFEDLSRVLQSATYIQPFAVIGMLLLIGPLFQAFRRHFSAPPSGLRVLLRGIAWLFFWTAAAAAPAAVVWARLRTDGAPVLVIIPVLAAVLAGGLLVLWFVLFWLLRTMFRIPIGLRVPSRQAGEC